VWASPPSKGLLLETPPGSQFENARARGGPAPPPPSIPAGSSGHEPSSERSCYLDLLPKSDLRPDATSIVRPCGATRTAAALSPLGLQRGRRRRGARDPAPRSDKRRAGATRDRASPA